MYGNPMNQPPMMGAPQQQFQQPVQFPQNTGAGWAMLANVPGIFIKQKVELLEAVTGIEGKNSYKVYGTDVNGEKVGEPIFKAKESSNCCLRICCPGDCRPYKMKLKDVRNGDKVIAHGKREFKCTCLCFNRPVIELYDGEQESTLLGKIVHKWACCSINMEIQDGNGQVRYYINASVCQMGIQCRQWPCKPCQQAKFDVLDANKSQVAHMTKRSSGFCKACCTDVDYFSLVFPQSATPTDKALLLMATLLIDYQYFEENELNNNGGGEGQYL